MQPDDASAPRAVLALIGLRCTGKTTLGRLLAAHFGVPFVDLDEALCALARGEGRGEPHAGALLAAVGEPAFRDLEQRALERVLAAGGARVLATGGGVVERAVNCEALSRAAVCVWLSAPSDVLLGRLRSDSTTRPPLVPGGAQREFERLAARRAPLYEALAALRLETGEADPPALLAQLAARLTCTPGRGFRLR